MCVCVCVCVCVVCVCVCVLYVYTHIINIYILCLCVSVCVCVGNKSAHDFKGSDIRVMGRSTQFSKTVKKMHKKILESHLRARIMSPTPKSEHSMHDAVLVLFAPYQLCF